MTRPRAEALAKRKREIGSIVALSYFFRNDLAEVAPDLAREEAACCEQENCRLRQILGERNLSLRSLAK